jgi:hypothetical protein
MSEILKYMWRNRKVSSVELEIYRTIEREDFSIKTLPRKLVSIEYKKGYRKVIKGKELIKHPIFGKFFQELYSFYIIRRVEVLREPKFSCATYYLVTGNEVKTTAKLLRDTYLRLVKENGFDPGFHPKESDEIIIYSEEYEDEDKEDYRPFEPSTISFCCNGLLCPFRISVLVPTNYNGVKILKGLEEKIYNLNPIK